MNKKPRYLGLLKHFEGAKIPILWYNNTYEDARKRNANNRTT